MTWDGIIPRKRRKSFERFVNHDDLRFRALAKRMQEEDRVTRRLMRAGNSRICVRNTPAYQPHNDERLPNGRLTVPTRRR